MSYISIPFGYVMKWLWEFVGNYGLAIILFTLATRLIILPLNIWIQKNSILMVKIQPDINFLKANAYGNTDAIAEGQLKIYKKAHYHPMLSIVPLIIQLFLLLCVMEIIYHPIEYLFSFNGEYISAIATHLGLSTSSSSYQIAIIDAVKDGTLTATTSVAGVPAAELSLIVERLSAFSTNFLGMNLCETPSAVWGLYVLVPVVAGFSSWLLAFTQNKSNVLQKEQSNWNKYGLMAISVGISLYLGFFVPAGTAVYWIAGNLIAIIQMYLLNWAINPRKYVDYEALESSRTALAAAKEFGAQDKKDPDYKENRRREKEDYKKFKEVAGRKIVFYSEKSGFYKYYKGIIEELLKRSNLNIHYVTNDPKDIIFELAKTEPKIKPYYIGLKKTAILMMMADTDMFVMTTPDLDKFYLKRSYVRKDAEYIYVPHDTYSAHLAAREGAFDAFDTVFCVGEHTKRELQKIEEVYGLKKKKLVEFGFPFIDTLIEAGNKANEERKNHPSPVKEILIAPSWQEDNILDSCLDDLIKGLYGEGYRVTVRPHPEYVKRYGYQLSKILEKYKDYDQDKLVFETDFSVNKSIYTSDIIITDWSAVAVEFCFATKRPAVFINTKMKCINPNWKKIDLPPVEITLRNEIGVSVEKENAEKVKEVIDELLSKEKEYKAKIEKRLSTFLYNLDGSAAKVGADYILSSLMEKQNARKNREQKDVK